MKNQKRYDLEQHVTEILVLCTDTVAFLKATTKKYTVHPGQDWGHVFYMVLDKNQPTIS